MKRIHLFEFNDLDWLPSLWRDMLTDYLHFASSSLNLYGPVVPKLKEVLERLKCRNLIDLCSGGTGSLLQIQQQLELKENYSVHITVTDKFPNIEAFRKANLVSKNHIKYIETSVDATDVPEHLKGFRTLFTSFHHFEADSARKILKDAVYKKEGIGIFEFTERSIVAFISILLSPIFVWLTTLFIKPFKWERLLWTYIVPIIPLIVLWDGVVSNLRTYSTEELQQLVGEIEDNNYTWDIGKLPSKGLARITYLIGYPKDH